MIYFLFITLVGGPLICCTAILFIAKLKKKGLIMDVDLNLSDIDNTNLQRRLSKINIGNPYALSSIASDRHKMLNDLLCVIHCDGGQYIAENGYKKSVNDAIEIHLKGRQ